MYASVRTYAGNRDLADTLAEHADDIRQVIAASTDSGRTTS